MEAKSISPARGRHGEKSREDKGFGSETETEMEFCQVANRVVVYCHSLVLCFLPIHTALVTTTENATASSKSLLFTFTRALSHTITHYMTLSHLSRDNYTRTITHDHRLSHTITHSTNMPYHTRAHMYPVTDRLPYREKESVHCTPVVRMTIISLNSLTLSFSLQLFLKSVLPQVHPRRRLQTSVTRVASLPW